MNVIWITADTFRQDHLRAYGKRPIHTPALDNLASKSMRFNRHYAAGFPTMPTRADHATGRWTMSFMGWEPLPNGVDTAATLLNAEGSHTAAMVDTPFYLRAGMNYDRGYQTFLSFAGQVGGAESIDAREAWRYEADRNVAQTMVGAMKWLERHYKEDFFLYVDTWDPHEPWDAPNYYTELYMPDYDGEVVPPFYGRWQDNPQLTEKKVEKAHATYCGEVTMVDAWIGRLLRQVEDMGLMENTAVIFTSDHGFYFGEHGGRFGKLTIATLADGSVPSAGIGGVIGGEVRLPGRRLDAGWGLSPLYEEIALIPLIIYVPGSTPGTYDGLTSAIDVMPTVLDIKGHAIPDWVQGISLLPKVNDPSSTGRQFTVTTMPFANPGDPVHAVDNLRRNLYHAPITTITANNWSLLYSVDEGVSELFNLSDDPDQKVNVITDNETIAKDLHKYLIGFMRDTNLPDHLVKPRLDLRI